MRAGLYVTPINWHLKAEEAGYIVEDCGAAVVVTSVALRDVAVGLEPYLGDVKTRLVIDGDIDGWTGYEAAIAGFPAEPLADEREGSIMFYSSGTTGRPKGIKPPLSGAAYGEAVQPFVMMMQMLFGLTKDSTYLCPAPLYHAAPLGWSTAVQRVGGTVVVMESFDAGRRPGHHRAVPDHPRPVRADALRAHAQARRGPSGPATTCRASRWRCTPPRRARSR